MSEAIIVAIISGGLSLAGVILTSLATSKKQERAAAVAQAVTDTKLDALTHEVRAHNNFAARMPVVEQEIDELKRRVTVLEKFHHSKN